jgi:hypothetical protein
MAKKKMTKNKLVKKEEANKTLKKSKQKRRNKVEAMEQRQLRRKESFLHNMKQKRNKSKICVSGNKKIGGKVSPIVMPSKNSGKTEEDKSQLEDIDGLKYHLIKLRSSSEEDFNDMDLLGSEDKSEPKEECLFELGSKTTVRKVRSRINKLFSI